jgi:ParB family transcriptional regulator, chromosome partitioning protein
MLLGGGIDMGHARALLAVDSAAQIQLAHRISARGLSVREAETLVARHGAASSKRPAQSKARSRDVVRLEDELSDALGAPVHLKADAKGRGQLVIRFDSLDQLDGIVARLRVH